jgi:hypothetical protein
VSSPTTLGTWWARIETRWIAGQAAIALTVASIRIRTVEPERLFGLVGEALPAQTDRVEIDQLTPEQRVDIASARRIGFIIGRMASLLPWHPSCLRQALAARWLLNRRDIPSVLHLGIADVASMDAHAWVTVSGYFVVGRSARRFTPVASFPTKMPTKTPTGMPAQMPAQMPATPPETTSAPAPTSGEVASET